MRGKLHMHEVASLLDGGPVLQPIQIRGHHLHGLSLAALEVGKLPPDFTADDLMQDSSGLELASYWLYDNQQVQQPLLEAVEEGRPLYEAAVAAGGHPETQRRLKPMLLTRPPASNPFLIVCILKPKRLCRGCNGVFGLVL